MTFFVQVKEKTTAIHDIDGGRYSWTSLIS